MPTLAASFIYAPPEVEKTNQGWYLDSLGFGLVIMVSDPTVLDGGSLPVVPLDTGGNCGHAALSPGSRGSCTSWPNCLTGSPPQAGSAERAGHGAPRRRRAG